MVMADVSKLNIRILAMEITVNHDRDQYPDWIEMLDKGNPANWDAVIETVKTDIEVSGVVYPLREEFHVSQVVN
jgi:hypothetical protein